MKLVAAKCPSCGANIDVDKKQEMTKCKYCKSQILVDDAIVKYKIEVEVNNMPKLENYLKLGKRFFKDAEYADSYKMYSRAVEISPDNAEAVLYQGLSKSLCTTYRDFELDDAYKSTKNVLNLINKEDKELSDKYILELVDVTLKLQKFAIYFYNENLFYLNQLEEYIGKLKECLFVFEFCYKKINNEKHKILIINKIIKLINYILKNKKYLNNYNEKEIYILDLKNRLELTKKKKEYKKYLHKIDPNLQLEDDIILNKKINLLTLIIFEIVILFFCISAFLENNNLISSIILFIDFVLVLPFISKKMFRNKKIGLMIKIILFIIGVLGAI